MKSLRSNALIHSLQPLFYVSIFVVVPEPQVTSAYDTQVELDTTAYKSSCGIDVKQKDSFVHVVWPVSSTQNSRLTFDLKRGQALIRSVEMSPEQSTRFQTIGEFLDPVIQVRLGKRDLKKRGGWTIFFDRMQQKPNVVYRANIDPQNATVSSNSRRATITIGEVSAGPFHGKIRWTFFAGSPFVLQEAVMMTDRKSTAFLYDVGLECREKKPVYMAWQNSLGEPNQRKTKEIKESTNLAVQGRAIAAQFDSGSIGIFPLPHRYFYPLDFSDNLKNIWMGPNYGEFKSPFGFGIRHDPRGDNRYVPWFNAPPGTQQEMGVFLIFADSTAKTVLTDISKLTRQDRFAELPGHKVFTSHFHVEHTLDYINRRAQFNYKEVVPTSRKQPQKWKYSLRRPSENWIKTEYDDSDWKTGKGGFGTRGTKGLKFGTNWSTKEIWLRRNFTLQNQPNPKTRIILQHDEDTEIYLNGTLAASVNGFTPGYRDLSILPAAMQSLRKGKNTIAIHCQNDGGGQGVDAGLGLVLDADRKVPDGLMNPGFVKVFKRMGVDIVHLAEFHNGRTPRLGTNERLEQLEILHQECSRLSNNDFLLLPGEEPNVHLGGHWISLFPKPVYWVLNRKNNTPFVTKHPRLGPVYHVGNASDVFRLLRAEHGLSWTAHPRIKGSTGFPDIYRNKLFYQSEQFLGGAWKAMPADLSKPRLGARVLDLLDDMSNWGHPKVALGEVDVFKIEPDHELYAHMNVNYLRLDEIPNYGDGWQPVLDALRGSKFFVTTGEVLIPKFTVNGNKSGENAIISKDQKAKLQLDLKWTFPLAYAEIITGDGKQIKRKRIDLSQTEAFGEMALNVELDVSGQRWLRVEVWDIATNGAFTQPVAIQLQEGR